MQEDLENFIKRILLKPVSEDEGLTREDIQKLRSVFQSGKNISLMFDNRQVVIERDAEEVIIVTGDNNTVDGSTKFVINLDLGQINSVQQNWHKLLPSFPSNYVPRDEILADVKKSLLNENSNSSSTSPHLISGSIALSGMPGIGKSVIARAVCEQVHEVFCDGILWITLGEDPDLVSELHKSVVLLGGFVADSMRTETALKANLTKLLHNKACLLIIDDVWRLEHLQAFNTIGDSCRLLFTTRITEIAENSGSIILSIPQMTVREAVKLLEKWAYGNLSNTSLKLKERIVQRFSCLPLAVRLAGAQLRENSPQKWLQEFEQLIDLEEWRAKPQDSLIACFQRSLDDLEEEDRQCYAALGIFREDEDIPESAISKLWIELVPSLSFKKIQKLLNYLARRALLEVKTETVLSGKKLTVRLHDLLREYLCERELANNKVQIHTAILNAYRKTQQGEGWHTVQDDDYYFSHLVYHLKEAGQQEELYRLLLGSPDWMETKFNKTGSDSSYLTDLEFELREISDPLEGNQLETLIQLRTAWQVVHWRVSRYKDIDLELLVWLGEEQKALNYSRLRPNAFERAKGLLVIYESLKSKGTTRHDIFNEIKRIAKNIPDDDSLSSKHPSVSKQLAINLADLGYFDEAIQATKKINMHVDYIRVLKKIALAIHNVGQKDRAEAIFYRLLKTVKRDINRRKKSNRGFAYGVQAAAELAIDFKEFGEVNIAIELLEFIELAINDFESLFENSSEQLEALGQLSYALMETNNISKANKVTTKALNIINSISNTYVNDADKLIYTLIQLEKFDQVGYIFQKLNTSYLDDVLEPIIVATTKPNSLFQIWELIRQIGEADVKAKALIAIAAAMAETNQKTDAKQLFEQAKYIAENIEDERDRIKILGMLVVTTFKMIYQLGINAQEIFNQLIEESNSINEDDDISYCERILKNTAIALAKIEYKKEALICLEQAQDISRKITRKYDQSLINTNLINCIAKDRGYKQARDFVKYLSNQKYGYDSDYIFGSLLLAAYRSGNYSFIKGIIRFVLEEKEYKDTESRDSFLVNFGENLALANQYDQSYEIVENEILDDRSKRRALSYIAGSAARLGNFDKAYEILEATESNADKLYILMRFVQNLSSDSDENKFESLIDLAQQALQKLGDDEIQACQHSLDYSLIKIASSISCRRYRIEAKPFFDKALEIIKIDSQEAEKNTDLARDLLDLADGLIKAEYKKDAIVIYKQVQEISQNIEDDETKMRILGQLAVGLAKCDLKNEANVTFDQLKDIIDEFDFGNDMLAMFSDEGSAHGMIHALTDLISHYFEAGFDDDASITLEQVCELLERIGFRSVYESTSALDLSARRSLFSMLIKRGLIARAFATLGTLYLDRFLYIISEQICISERFEQYNTLDILQESIRIAGWVRSDWKNVYEYMREQ